MIHCNSCGDEAHDAADALARAWVNVIGPLWICPPCDVAPRCRVCDGITRTEGVRLCDRCERDAPAGGIDAETRIVGGVA